MARLPKSHLSGRQVASLVVAVIVAIPATVALLNVEKWAEKKGYDQLLVEYEGPIVDYLTVFWKFISSDIAIGIAIGGVIFAFAPSLRHCLLYIYRFFRNIIGSILIIAGRPRYNKTRRIALGYTAVKLSDEILAVLADRDDSESGILEWMEMTRATNEKERQHLWEKTTANMITRSADTRNEVTRLFGARVEHVSSELRLLGYLDKPLFGWNTNPLSMRDAANQIGGGGYKILQDCGVDDASIKSNLTNANRN